jgi:hypothetical protein
LIGVEREADGRALRFAERRDESAGSIPHAPGRIDIHAKRLLADALRNGFAQLLRQQDSSSHTQSKLSSVHATRPYLFNDMRSSISINLVYIGEALRFH